MTQRLSLGAALLAVLTVLGAGGAAGQAPPLRPAPDTTPITGQPRFLNTASIALQGKRIVFFGVDPMMAQQPCSVDNQLWDCGTAAMRILMNLIGREPVTCEPRLAELGGRIYAKCFVNGKDIGLALVEAGMAVTVPSETTEYEAALQEAVRKKVGVWRGQIVTPQAFRNMRTPDEVQPR